MARSTSSASADGGILHFGLTRMRVTGSGNLLQTLFSLDEVKSDVLAPTVLQSTTDTEPTRLANFTQQRASLEFKTVRINEVFNISKIIIFVKPVASSYPQ